MIRDGVVPWPADLAYAYRVAGCWRGRTLGSYLWEWAEQRGDRIAVVDGDRRLSYRDLAIAADRLAAELAGLGLGPGDTVIVQLPNCWEFVVATFACFRSGVVPVMMLPAHREYELSAVGAHVGAKAVLVPDRWRGYDHQRLARDVADGLPGPAHVLVVGDEVYPGSVDVRAVLRDAGERDAAARRDRFDACHPGAADVAVFLLSGGTTGIPKVIARTHDDYAYNIRRAVEACGFGPETRYLAVLPAGHNFPLANPGILGALYAGGRVVMLPSPRPDAVFETIEAERVTVTSAVPAVALKWLEAAGRNRHDLTTLQYIHIGGSMLAPEVAARIGPALGCRIQQVYGMAEGLVCYTPLDAPDAIAHATQGRPISPYDELRVVDPDGHAVAPGQVGELLTRGPYTPRGYFRALVQNQVSFTADGWYRTGDLVRITPDGYVVVCGRVKDLINRAGEKISAGEIEALMQELPGIAEAAAVAIPDPEVGERVCAFVRPHPGSRPTLDTIREALTARGLAVFKLPERLELVDELPHTPIGKPDKKALRARAAGR
ncbi:(2,3-dihydroxybenzoyl)adenylate synthase [Allorhizocola rhizosphaerae]|uniref:(2,3-dihydroxybenzoyl)adenylate synthase n=1 Tax=Allorhizocola rhizosphaerae TaxID=1872709 RepID=UPI001FE4D44F|nr:AMP-binding protein [Allorhizocola rhizosphaerae]